MAEERDLMRRASELIRDKQYDRARVLLEQMPNNPKAQQWLSRLQDLDPQPTNLDEARQDLQQAEGEMLRAERQLIEAEHELDDRDRSQRRATVRIGLLVFLGSLLGSLLGAADSLGGAIETIEEIDARLNPPPKLCIVGSDTILGQDLGLSLAWEETFEAEHNVEVIISDIGSSNGVRRAASGQCAQVLAMSEPMTEAHQETLRDAGVRIQCAAEIGYDVIAFITDINNPIESVQSQSLIGVLRGGTYSWGEMSTEYDERVTVLAREGSGTTELVLREFAYYNEPGFPAGANYVACENNADCLNLTLSIPGSIYWSSVAWIRSQPREYLNPLLISVSDDAALINPLADEEERLDLDQYPSQLTRPLYMYVVDNGGDAEQLELAREFLGFVRGLQGQQLLSEHFYTYFDRPRDVDIELPTGFTLEALEGEAYRNVCRYADR